MFDTAMHTLMYDGFSHSPPSNQTPDAGHAALPQPQKGIQADSTKLVGNTPLVSFSP